MSRKGDLPIIQQDDQNASEQSWWRSLDELAQTPEFQEALAREFPENASELVTGSRRDFMRVMGASLLLAGATGCNIKPPQEKIVPVARMADHAKPGLPLYFTSAMDFAGSALGLTVQSRDGRPIKVEGNSNHPASLGATSIFAQAATLDLYDPDRMTAPTRKGKIVTRKSLDQAISALRGTLDETGGRGLRLLIETSTSPTLRRLLDALTERWPEARWLVYDAVDDDHIRAGMRLAFGEAGAERVPIYDFAAAERVLSIDFDFLADRDVPPRYIQDFSESRRIAGRGDEEEARMGRLYSLASTPCPTSAKADRPLTVGPRMVWEIVRAIAGGLGVDVQGAAGSGGAQSEPIATWVKDLVEDLQSHGKTSLVVAGRDQPPQVHALTHAINEQLGAVGTTVRYVTSPQVRRPEMPANSEMLTHLTEEIYSGEVESLLILGGNPVFTAPADIDFPGALARLSQTAFTLALSLSRNETSDRCLWGVARSHFLEQWADARAYEGTASIIQPLISPLYQSLSEIELLALLTEDSSSGYRAVRKTWRDEIGEGEGDGRWQEALAKGVIPGTSYDDQSEESSPESLSPQLEQVESPYAAVAGGEEDDSPEAARFDLVLKPDPTVWDGRYVNNGWLQELPKPLESIVWDNTVWISLADAQDLRLKNRDVVRIGEGETAVEMPVWIVPGHAEGVLTVFFGYGREVAGRVGAGTGFDAYPLTRTYSRTTRLNVPVQKTEGQYHVVTTQHHQMMEGRHIVRSGTLEQYREHPEHPSFAHVNEPHPEATLYEPWEYPEHKWGMVIDLTACVGCSACTIACQAENNIPVVGKRQCDMNRHMHWIRVDTYHEGAPEMPKTLTQPVPCMQCERAPCEYVCPVAATTHSSDGLNQMVYNRCVGTRYCSNNCPYKVRRFNFHDYSEKFISDDSLELLSNPEVTMRGRGVMEKCTYCVQRIQHAKIASEVHNKPIRDGDVKTACQTVCPANAIVFGDLNDQESLVRTMRDDSLNYTLLEELNTEPRTTYLAEVTNPGKQEPIGADADSGSHSAGEAGS